jgi:hypothetical protein
MGRTVQPKPPEELTNIRTGDRITFGTTLSGNPNVTVTVNRLEKPRLTFVASVRHTKNTWNGKRVSEWESSPDQPTVWDGKRIGEAITTKDGDVQRLVGRTSYWTLQFRTDELDSTKRSGYARIYYPCDEGTDDFLVRRYQGYRKEKFTEVDASHSVMWKDVTVTKGTPPARILTKGQLKGITKSDLIAYVIAVHGPMQRDDVLKAVAKLEGKPYTAGSNFSYFGNEGMLGNGQLTSIKVGKGKGSYTAFYVAGAGMVLAARVVKELGEGPAKEAYQAPADDTLEG